MMINDLVYIMQTATIEQLKAEIDKNVFVDKNLKDFNKGKEIVDNLLELNKTSADDSVKYALILYCIYKIKGGKWYEWTRIKKNRR